MFKYAVVFLIVSLIAGALGLTNVSQVGETCLDGPVRAVLPRYSSRSWALPIWPAKRSTGPPSPRLRP